MNTNKLKAFISATEKNKSEEINPNDNPIIINQKDGLIERVDRKIIDTNGRQLLKEQLFEIN